MTDAVFEKLTTVDLATLVAIIILIVVVVNFLTPILTKLKDKIISKYKKDQKSESLSKTVQEDHERIAQYEANRIHDREQSFKIQKELTDAISKLNDRLDKMHQVQEDRYQESLARENKRVRAELKDRISQSYRYYNSAKRWNHIEKETLEDLISEYESAGGVNSFVHDKVIPEMYTWELVDCGYIPHDRT